MGNYPVIQAVPHTQPNKLVCTVPPFGATQTQVPLDTMDLEQIVPAVAFLDPDGALDTSSATFQTQSGVLGVYDPGLIIGNGERNRFCLHMPALLFGTADATAAAGFATGDGMPGYAEEAAWCLFVTNANPTDADAAISGGTFQDDAAKYAWQLQVWALVWHDHVIAGLLPPDARWLIEQTTTGDEPTLYAKGYGLDVVDQVPEINAAAASMIAQLNGWMVNARHFTG